jgi:hypothetical protein
MDILMKWWSEKQIKTKKPQIINEIFKIAENPALNFKRYTIGFDANCLSF